jgi:phage terminase large subunit-like protein
VRCLGYDPYNAKEFVERWVAENGPFGVEKVMQGAKTESVPLGELKKLSEDRELIFDQSLMSWSMGNAITLEDTNGNRKLLKKRQEEKIDNVAALMDAYIAHKANREAFESRPPRRWVGGRASRVWSTRSPRTVRISSVTRRCRRRCVRRA